jgi:hypothetical protein
MPAVCFAADPQQWPFSICNSTGYKPHDESDSRFIGTIRIRPVNDSAVMKGHFAWLQYNIHGLRFIDFNVDSLATSQ